MENTEEQSSKGACKNETMSESDEASNNPFSERSKGPTIFDWPTISPNRNGHHTNQQLNGNFTIENEDSKLPARPTEINDNYQSGVPTSNEILRQCRSNLAVTPCGNHVSTPKSNNLTALDTTFQNGKNGFLHPSSTIYFQNAEGGYNPTSSRMTQTQQYSRGRQPYRISNNSSTNKDPSSVPLRFIHVPTTSSAINDAKRTPSVPDLTMYSKQNSATSTTATTSANISNMGFDNDGRIVFPMNSTTLSEAMLRNNERGNAKEHLEERLRRAELRLSTDFSNEFAARYRSKSTPSRWAHAKRTGKRENDTNVILGQITAYNIPMNLNTGGTDVCDNVDQGHDSSENGFNNESYQTQHNFSDGLILKDESPSTASFKDLNSSALSKPSPVVRGNISNETTLSETFTTRTGKCDFNAENMDDRSKTNILLRASIKSEDFDLEAPIVAGNRSFQEEDESDFHNPPSPLAADVDTHNSIHGHFSGKSSDVSVGTGSRNSRDMSVTLHEDTRIPAPPPPPPPATEKERLVQRERQARLETEHARRRHIALLRERHLNDDIDNADTEDEILIGQISFDDGTNTSLRDHMLDVEAQTGGIHAPSDPRFIGENFAATSTLPDASSSIAGSDISIHRPPLPPPPATERERLVERERQARLETERARRRQALLRERQADINDRSDYDGGSNLSRGGSNASSSYHDDIVQNVSRVMHEAPSSEGQNHDAEAGGLSYTMERFLETLGEEESGDVIPVEVSDNSELSQLRMELFLAENVALNAILTTGHHRGDVNDGGGFPPHYQVSRPTINANLDSNLEPHMHSIDENHPHPDTYTGAGRVVGDGGSIHQNQVDSVPPTDEICERTERVPSTSFEDVTERNSSNTAPPGSTVEPNNITTNSTLVDDRLLSTAADVIEVLSLQGSNNANSLPDTNHLLRQLVESSNERISTATIHDNLEEENTQDLSPTSSRQSTAHSRDSITTNPAASRHGGIFPQLTEAGIAHLDEVEQASIGNAPPLSYRDESSEISEIGRNFHDNVFSVATQTTVIESVTETSVDGQSEDERIRCNRSSNGSNIIRVDSVVTRSSGARSASLQAMRSSESESTSSRDISTSSDESSHLSHDFRYPIPLLTEADIEAMVEIENASIGNAPPHSVRDDHLSESSVIGHSSQIEADIDHWPGHRATATPLSDLESLDENSLPSSLGAQIGLRNSSDIRDSYNGQSQLGGGASVEAMPSDCSDHDSSRHSIEGLLSQHGESSSHHDFHGSDDEDMIVYQASDMASSTSIEALPDLEPTEYVAINESVTIGSNLGHVVIDTGESDGDHTHETTPLLSPIRTFGESISPVFEKNGQVKEEGNIDYNVKMYPIIVQLIAEVPAIMFILEYGADLCTLVGMRRYQMIIASLVVLLSIFTQPNHQSLRMFKEAICSSSQQTSTRRTIRKHTFVCVSVGGLLGVIACVCTGFDYLFGLVMACSILVALIASNICCFALAWTIRFSCIWANEEWIIPVVTSSQDLIRCIVLLQFSRLLSSVVGPLSIEDDDMC